ncbi:MAG: TapY2 family type IVa secretion system protein [Shewanella sp.]|nr:TapY2 family type IVa secretion system protein [Shewanella sp.]MCF1430967.1 TapY2 family type IVa secretion system protein [Shewanella sp.]MCF1438024.1 TapY2 family type IVa secretion system protein [Shewanella sp.]MCF1459392.1 TapY2 family type IVa secretion system protein [Shewanella sp.]
MKTKMIGICLAVLAASGTFSVQAASDKKASDYKCYLETTRGHQIGFYRWKENKKTMLMAKLVGMQTYSKDKPKPYIKEVLECVKLHDEFSSESAQQLDKMTAR